jgi:K+-transporting ATPase ATPase C chain
MSYLRPSIAALILFTILTGGVYPVLVTGITRLCFPRQAEGSFVAKGGHLAGSALIGQAFDGPRDFWGRPSATTPSYNAAASSGSNLGPLNPALRDAVAQRVRVLRQADPGNPAPVPIDLVTASASGLDPHITPAAAFFQVHRVARARGLDPAAVERLVREHMEGRQLGLLGEPRVNVLLLNLALDQLRK